VATVADAVELKNVNEIGPGVALGFAGVQLLGAILCLTVVGAVIGIPLWIGGYRQQRRVLKAGLRGPCPYCGSSVTASSLMPGVKCLACKKRIVVKGNQFVAVP
jgi:DNA-directed RNA polymerase subunit RPC12/RpoP